MEAMDFNPGSLFGIPVVPFPPGMRWNTRREMLHEVMTDLHRDWVQDYLLRHDAGDDARILSSPAKLTKSKSFTYVGLLDYNRPQMLTELDLRSTILIVPAFKTDDISAGVCIGQESSYGPPPEFISCKSNFQHFVRNDRTGALCIVHLDEKKGFVELFYYISASMANYVHLSIRFKTSDFLKAVKTGNINFDILEQSMMTMNVGYSTLGPSVCTCQQPGCVECRGTCDSLTRGFSRSSIPLDFVHYGDFYSRTVLSEFEEGVLMKTIPLFGYSSTNPGAPDFCIDKLVRWGMTDRLGRLKSAVPVVIPFTFEIFEDSGENGTFSNVKTCAQNDDGVLFDETCGTLLLPPCDNEPEQVQELDDCGVWLLDSSIDPSEVVSLSSENMPRELPSIQMLSQEGPPRYEDFGTGAVRIAPAPSKPSTGHNVSVAVKNAIETARFAKLERRKIRKREAAFRSSAKRSERRRIARLAREKEKEACQEGQ